MISCLVHRVWIAQQIKPMQKDTIDEKLCHLKSVSDEVSTADNGDWIDPDVLSDEQDNEQPPILQESKMGVCF